MKRSLPSGERWTCRYLSLSKPSLSGASVSFATPATGKTLGQGAFSQRAPLRQAGGGARSFRGTANVSSPTGGLTDVVAVTPSDAYAITNIGTIHATTQTGAAVTGDSPQLTSDPNGAGA
jgi:hypothetical protein